MGAERAGRDDGASASRSRVAALEVRAAGRATAAGVVVTYAAGVALGYPQLTILAAGGIVALTFAAVLVAIRPRIRCTRAFEPSAVTTGEAAVAVLEVTNDSRLPSPPVRVADRLGATEIELPIRVLPAGGSTLARYSLPTMRRGRVSLGPLRIVRADPLELLRTRQDAGGRDVLWVHPRTWPMSPPPAGVIADFEGPVSETGTEGTFAFSSLREYVPGDDRRQIHWRSSARVGTLLVRRNVDGNEPRAKLVIDTRLGPWTAESFEDGIEVAASAARALALAGHPIDLRVLAERSDDPQLEGVTSLADHLAVVERRPEADARGLYTLLEHGEGGGSLVVVTGRYDPAVESWVGRQARRYAPVVLCCVDAGAPVHWQRRSGINVVTAPTAPRVAELWNRLFSR